MRNPLLQRVVEAENEAKSIVESARAEAERIQAEAERQARARASPGRQAHRRAREQLLERALAEARGEKERRLAEAARAIEHEVILDDPTRQKLVDAVVRCACGLQDAQEGG